MTARTTKKAKNTKKAKTSAKPRKTTVQKLTQAKARRETLSGAEIVLRALKDQNIKHVFGYPGGATLPIYDALYGQNYIEHVLGRHEQGCVHAAEGYARSTGQVGVVLVTSGPGATNAVTGLTDALMDSIPLVCITGQVPSHLIGNDAFQEADTTGITRACTKHNYLVKDIEDLPRIMHEAFHVARSGRPGPVLVDIPKDIQFATTTYHGPESFKFERVYNPPRKPDIKAVEKAVDLMARAKRPVFYTGGGVINSGPKAAQLLQKFVKQLGFPITSTLMGLGAYPTTDDHFLGMLGMHGTLEANFAMYHCDCMINLGARFDDRVTGDTEKFSPGSRKIHVDIDAAQINKNIQVDIPIVGDVEETLKLMIKLWREKKHKVNQDGLDKWWQRIERWRAKDCLKYKPGKSVIKPQQALEALRDQLKKHKKEVYISTEVGQHQMWAAQFMPFEAPNRWLTSGGLGTMGYGLPAAIGAQMAHPKATVIDIAGEASTMMNIQELATAAQYRLPIKVFILNNEWMGMVRQWQQLIHGERYSQSYSEALPDFVALAEAFGCIGLRAEKPEDLDGVIKKMLKTDKPTIVDVRVDPKENCFPMMPAGAPHNEIFLNEKDRADSEPTEEELILT